MVLGGSWPPSELNTMPFDEYLTWYNLAYERHQAQEKANSEA